MVSSNIMRPINVKNKAIFTLKIFRRLIENSSKSTYLWITPLSIKMQSSLQLSQKMTCTWQLFRILISIHPETFKRYLKSGACKNHLMHKKTRTSNNYNASTECAKILSFHSIVIMYYLTKRHSLSWNMVGDQT